MDRIDALEERVAELEQRLADVVQGRLDVVPQTTPTPCDRILEKFGFRRKKNTPD